MNKYALVVGAMLSLAGLAGCDKEKLSAPAPVNTISFLVNGSATAGNHNFFSFVNGAQVPVA
ncbi:MAG: hypothetical protein ACO3BD_08610, partial [Chitinophagaceae bacterium]